MDHFIHRENLAHYRRLLAEPNVTNDPVRHERLYQLLANEIAKGATAPGCSPNSESDSDEQASALKAKVRLRDLGAVLEHEEPLPHPACDRVQ